MKNRRFIASIAIVAGIVGGGAALTACSSGPSGPPNATSVLQSDGYTPSAAYTSALQSGLGGAPDGTVLSSQAGTNSNDQIQLVVVFDNATDAQAGLTGVQTQYGSDGITSSASGQVLTATGTVAGFEQAGADAAVSGGVTSQTLDATATALTPSASASNAGLIAASSQVLHGAAALVPGGSVA